MSAGRCAAAHPQDSTPCEGPQDAVKIVDRHDGEVLACVHHGARMLASLTGGRVYPHAVEGAAIEAHRRAQGLPPFCWFKEGGDRP